MEGDKKRILILGGSGFLGHALYRELGPYYKTFATYCTATRFSSNRQFFPYDFKEDDVFELLEKLRPHIVISALRGEFPAQILAHQHLIEYIRDQDCKLIFLSAANVFDAYSQYPSYEYDKTLSMSIYGRFKIKIENMLLRLPAEKSVIVRLPMVFGNGSPRIAELQEALEQKEAVEVFPNLIINVAHVDKFTQQLHYIINRELHGLFHLGSNDLVHHEELIHQLVLKMGLYNPVYKRVFTTNDDRYLAVLPKHNRLPAHLQFSYQDTIDHHFQQDI